MPASGRVLWREPWLGGLNDHPTHSRTAGAAAHGTCRRGTQTDVVSNTSAVVRGSLSYMPRYTHPLRSNSSLVRCTPHAIIISHAYTQAAEVEWSNEVFVPERCLRGLLPAALTTTYRFWRTAPNTLRGYPTVTGDENERELLVQFYHGRTGVWQVSYGFDIAPPPHQSTTPPSRHPAAPPPHQRTKPIPLHGRPSCVVYRPSAPPRPKP